MPYVLVLYLDIEKHLGKVHYDFSTYVVFRSPFSPNFGMRKCLCIVTKHRIMQRQDTNNTQNKFLDLNLRTRRI